MLKENLVILRNISGYSQEEIAEKIGISRQAYAKWESGATVPDIEKCSRLAEVYGTTVDGLIKTAQAEGIGTVPPPPDGKNIWGAVTIDERGQVVIPKGVRDKFGLTPGTRLVVLSDDREGIALVPAEKFEASVRQMMTIAAKTMKE